MSSTAIRGADSGYETKVILVALAKLVSKSKTVEEVYQHLVSIANVEGVVIKPLKKEENN